jgi:phenylpropionate dioxygenase-like ring-hydroxylating dioxygenase large terminal subunit
MSEKGESLPAPCNWYVACHPRDLRRGLAAIEILGHPVVVFRDAHGVHAFEDRCPHRNLPLSQGRVEKGELICAYHGWRFDGSGRCRQIPGRASANGNCGFSVRTYATLEHDGWIWVAPAGIPESPPPTASLGSNFDVFYWQSDIKCALIDGLENLLDATHTHFVHAGLVRFDRKRRRVTARVAVDQRCVEVRYSGEDGGNGLISRLFEGKRSASIGRFFAPSIAQLEYRDQHGERFVLQAYFTPKRDDSLRVHLTLGTRRGFWPGWLKEIVLGSFFRRVLAQDHAVLQAQATNIARFGKPSYHSTELDLIRPWIEKMIAGMEIQPFEKSVELDI